MWLIYVPGALCVLILLILFSHLTVRFGYLDGEMTLHLSYLFLRLPLLPKRQKLPSLRKFSKKRYDKMLAKEEAKRKKKAAKKAGESTKKEPPVGEEKEKSSVNIPAILDLVRDTLQYLIERFTTHIKVKRFLLNIRVGGSDAAKTAVTYGVVAQGVAYITEILNKHADTTRVKAQKIDVQADFLSLKSTFDMDIILKIRVIHFLKTGLHVLLRYMKNMK